MMEEVQFVTEEARQIVSWIKEMEVCYTAIEVCSINFN